MTASGEPRRIVFVAANPSIDRLYEVDRLTDGAIHRPLVVVARAGGKGLNAARAAVVLGARITVAGIVAGHAGDWIAEQLTGLGIDARMARAPGETRTCVSILDRSSGRMTEVYERGDDIGPDAWDALEASIAAELERGDVGALTLSGSLPPGAPMEGYARIARIAAERSIPVIADAYGPALALVLSERPAVVKVNAVEAADAAGLSVGDPAEAAAAAHVLLRHGARAVVVTLGIAGAVVVNAADEARLVPPDILGDYPVGSGDAFLAGLAAAVVEGAPLVDAARSGMAAAIANAFVPGTGDLDPSFAARLASDILVTPL